MMWDGVPPTIVLSEKANGPQKGYRPGDTIGPWKLVSVDSSYADFEWDGKEFKKRIDELIDRTPIVQAAAPPANAAAPAAPTAAAAKTLSNRLACRPGPSKWAPDSKSCYADDTSPERHHCGWHEEDRHRDAVWKRLPLGTSQVEKERGIMKTIALTLIAAALGFAQSRASYLDCHARRQRAPDRKQPRTKTKPPQPAKARRRAAGQGAAKAKRR